MKMNQVKIGKFIAELRKEKDLTQKDLAEKIGVTDKAISKWENGRGMPDVSLLRKISEVLGITVNELLSAEKIDDKDKARKLEENYFCAVDSKIKLQNDVAGHILLKFLGYVLLLIAYGYFDTEPFGWVNTFIIVGIILIGVASYKLVKIWNLVAKIVYVSVVCLALIIVVLQLDFHHVDDREISHPHFYIKKVERGKCIAYRALTWSCLSYKDNENKNNNGGLICDYGISEDAIKFTKEKYCDEDYDYRYDCDVVKCDENGIPLVDYKKMYESSNETE
jgi:transcriptional regulator with XRE-family HTH domain